jgi:hypothetical protein
MSAATAVAPPFPAALSRAAVREGRYYAVLASIFLDRIETAYSHNRTYRIPLAAVLQLGAALRLLTWENAGITAHRSAGLPPAREALITAARVLAGVGSPDPEFPTRVLGVYLDCFAWDAPDILKADAVVSPLQVEEDVAVKAVAEFLWAARRPRTPNRED